MVGGTVIEVSEVSGRPEVLFVDCRDRTYAKDTCAIYVERNQTSERIELGDCVWWQGRHAYWTPQTNRERDEADLGCGIDFDIPLPRVGFSGVTHPSRTADRD